MSPTTSRRWQTATVALTPVALLAAFLWHPYLPGRLPNEEVVAAAVAADTTRWAAAHLAAGVASAVVVLAFLAVRSWLRAAGDERWSAIGVPLVVLGSILFTLLPGMEFAPLAAVETGGDPEAAQAALERWFVPVLASGGIVFTLGMAAFARALVAAAVLPRDWTRAVVVALVVMGLMRLVPFAVAQFHLQGVAAIVALWPLAAAMARGPVPVARPAAQSQARPAT